MTVCIVNGSTKQTRQNEPTIIGVVNVVHEVRIFDRKSSLCPPGRNLPIVAPNVNYVVNDSVLLAD